MVLEQKTSRIPEKKTRAINNIDSPFSTDKPMGIREGPPLRARTAETYRQALGWPASAARPGTEAKGRSLGGHVAEGPPLRAQTAETYRQANVLGEKVS